MNDLVNKLLVSPFDRACQAALTRIDTSNPEHVEVVEKLCKQHKELFLGRIRREDGSYKAQSITNELHAGLAYYRSRLMKIWKYEKDEADEAFYFPEKAPLDWVWLVGQFIGIQDAVLGGKPYQIKPYKITIDLLPEGYFEKLLCSLFAKTSQLIAYKQVARDEKLIIDVAAKLESEIKEAARMITRRHLDLWKKPPFKENLQKAKKYRAWLELEKTNHKKLGLPLGLTLSIDTEDYLNHLDSEIESIEALEKYLHIEIENSSLEASSQKENNATYKAIEQRQSIEIDQTATNKDLPVDSIDWSKYKNSVNGLPLPDVFEFFSQLARTKGGNGDPYLSLKDVENFVLRAFCEQDKALLSLNLGGDPIKKVGGLFYLFYTRCRDEGFANLRNDQSKYVMLMRSFTNFSQKSLDSNFNHFKEETRRWKSTF